MENQKETIVEFYQNSIDDQISKFKLMIKIIILNFKYLFHNKKNLLLLTIIPLLALIIPVFLAPLFYSYPAFVTLGVLGPAALTYCSTAYEWRKGTLYPSLLTTRSNKYIFYFASFLFMLIMVWSLYIITLMVLVLMNQVGLLLHGWAFIVDHISYLEFGRIYFIPTIYSLFELTLVTFSIFFFFQNLAKSNVSLYMVLFAIAVLQFIFGGLFTQYFLKTTDLPDTGTSVPQFKGMLFPEDAYWFSYLMDPLFGPSMHIQSISSKWLYNNGKPAYGGDNKFIFWIWETNSNTFGLIEKSSMFKWNLLWITPYIWTCLFATLGVFVSSAKK